MHKNSASTFFRRLAATVRRFFQVLAMCLLAAFTWLPQAANAQQEFRAGDCKQSGGPLTCTVAKVGKIWATFGSDRIEGASVEDVFAELLVRNNAWEIATRTPPGQQPIIWVPDPSVPACTSANSGWYWPGGNDRSQPVHANFYSTACALMPTLGGIVWGGSSRVTIYREAICPVGWNFYGSVAPGYFSAPGYCSMPLSPKNLPCEPCLPGTKSPFGNPIEASIFNKEQQEVDYAASGPMGLKIVRSYNSGGTPTTLKIGEQWRLGYDRTISVDGTGYATVFHGRGAAFGFRLSGGLYVAEGDVNNRLTKNVDASGALLGWTYRTAVDDVETYNSMGKLISVVDRSGATQVFTYDANERLARVTDSFGRVMNLAYDGVGRVTNITLDSGEVYTYTYNSNNTLRAATYPDQRSRTYLYGEGAYTAGVSQPFALTGIVDENNTRFATFGYDAQLRAVSTEYSGGVNKYVLSGGGNTTNVIDPLGVQFARTYTIASELTRRVSAEIQPCASLGCAGTVSTTMTYDANGNLASRNDFKGNRTCYAYDLSRNLETTRVEGLLASAACTTAIAAATQTAPARKITTTWHATFRLPATITEPVTGGSKVTTNTYDANGNLSQRQVATPAGTRVWNWAYDSFGRVLTATDPLGRTTTNTYYPNTAAQNTTLANSRGMLASTTNVLGHTTSITAYNPHGQPLSMTDANGLTTTMTYDARQRLTSRTVGAETTTYEYDGVGQLTKVTLPDNSFLTYTYDGAHRLTQIQDGLGNKMAYTLDNMGNRLREDAIDPLNALARTRSRVYDPLNRLQRDIGGTIPSTQITQYAYDANGNQTAMTDPLARVTSNTYDALNRLIQVNDPLNGVAAPTKYEYDAQDNLTKVIDPKNLATTYNYNGFNELVSQVSPDTGSASFTYDAAGNMLSKTDARSVTVSYGYDALNRVTSINYPATTSATGTAPAQSVNYLYDACGNGKGRLCSFTDRTGSTRYSYDLQGRVLDKTQSVNGLTQTVGYRYNPAGQMDEMTLPSGKKVAVTYSNNRVVGMRIDDQPIIKTAEYEPFGPIGEWTWGNDTPASPNKHTRYFDLDGRNTKIESGPTSGTSATAIDPAIIVYDAASRITALQRLTSNVVDPAKSASYAYDNLDRLTTATPGAGNSALTQSYSYDAIGNRLSNNVNGSITNYAYGTTTHRLTSLSGATAKTFGYDAAGNRLTDGIQSWIYGGDGRPSAISLAGTTPTSIQSGINALGQRVLKTVNSSAQGTSTRFVYDEAGRLIGEYDLNGRPIQETIWLNDLPVAVLK